MAFTNGLSLNTLLAAVTGKGKTPAAVAKSEAKAIAAIVKKLQAFESKVEADKKATLKLVANGVSISQAFDPKSGDEPPAGGVTFLIGDRLLAPSAISLTDAAALAALKADAEAAVAGPQGARMSGKVIDGYLSGATVFIDYDGDGVRDADEPQTTTDADGDYTLVGTRPGGVLVASGGTNIDTGNPNTLVLRVAAADGQNSAATRNLTPVTTLVQQVAERAAGVGAAVTAEQLAAAEAAVKQALGLNMVQGSLLAFDPVAVVNSATTTAADKAAALEVFKAGVQIATLAVAAQAADTVAPDAAVVSRVLGALANSVAAAGPQEVGGINLADASVLGAVLQGAGVVVQPASVQQLAQANQSVDAATSTQQVATAQNAFEDAVAPTPVATPAPTPVPTPAPTPDPSGAPTPAPSPAGGGTGVPEPTPAPTPLLNTSIDNNGIVTVANGNGAINVAIGTDGIGTITRAGTSGSQQINFSTQVLATNDVNAVFNLTGSAGNDVVRFFASAGTTGVSLTGGLGAGSDTIKFYFPNETDNARDFNLQTSSGFASGTSDTLFLQLQGGNDTVRLVSPANTAINGFETLAGAGDDAATIVTSTARFAEPTNIQFVGVSADAVPF